MIKRTVRVVDSNDSISLSSGIWWEKRQREERRREKKREEGERVSCIRFST
jgi:hypothetical protein